MSIKKILTNLMFIGELAVGGYFLTENACSQALKTKNDAVAIQDDEKGDQKPNIYILIDGSGGMYNFIRDLYRDIPESFKFMKNLKNIDIEIAQQGRYSSVYSSSDNKSSLETIEGQLHKIHWDPDYVIFLWQDLKRGEKILSKYNDEGVLKKNIFTYIVSNSPLIKWALEERPVDETRIDFKVIEIGAEKPDKCYGKELAGKPENHYCIPIKDLVQTLEGILKS